MPDIVVSDVAAQAIAAAITAQTTAQAAAATAHALQLESLLGKTAVTTSPGGITAATTRVASHLEAVLGALNEQTKAVNQLNMSVAKVAESIETLTTAAASIQFTMTKQLTTQQLAVSDQMNNNKFNQLTTNAALERAELPATEVKPTDMKTTIVSGIENIGVVNAQTTASSLLTQGVTEAATEGFAISQKLIAQSTFGKWVGKYYADAKIQAQLLFADAQQKQALLQAQEKVKAVKLTPLA